MPTKTHTESEIFQIYNDFHFVCDTGRFKKLFARLELYRLTKDIPGVIIDAGVYKGVSTIQFAHMVATYEPNSKKKVIGFDTFEGFFPRQRPDESEMADFHMTTYDPNAYLSLCSTIERLGLEDRIEVIKGDIVETLPSYFSSRPGARVSMLHCDLDVFEPTLETLKSIWPRLVPGGIAIFDEYAVDEWGESDAVDEFFQSQNIEIQLQASAFSRTPTAYCIKSRFS